MTKITITLILLSLSIMAFAQQPIPKDPKEKTFVCVVDEPLNPYVTTLKCPDTYRDLPKTQFRVVDCATVNLTEDAEGHISFADDQPKGCTILRAHECSGAELADDYPRPPIQPAESWVMPCINPPSPSPSP